MRSEGIKIFNKCCFELMAEYPDGYFDLAIVDPPYNIKIDDWDNIKQYEQFIRKLAKELNRVLKRTGTMEEKFGVGFFEDDDYCNRVREAGYDVAVIEDVFVHHHLSASFNKLKAEKKQELFDRNKKIYEDKWGNWIPHKYRDGVK